MFFKQDKEFGYISKNWREDYSNLHKRKFYYII